MNERDFIDRSAGQVLVLRRPGLLPVRPVSIDKRRARILTPGIAWGYRERPLASVRQITIRVQSSRHGTYYSTELIAEGWKTVVWILPRYPDIRLLSERLAEELSVPLVDESIGAAQLRQPDQLDTAVRDRASDGSGASTGMTQPAAMHCRILRDGPDLVIEAPPSSVVSTWVKGLLFGLLLLPLIILSILQAVMPAMRESGLFVGLWVLLGAVVVAITADMAHARVVWRVNESGLLHLRQSPVSRRETFLGADSIEELFSVHRPSLRQQLGGRDTRHVGIIARGDQYTRLLPAFDADDRELDFLTAEIIKALRRSR